MRNLLIARRRWLSTAVVAIWMLSLEPSTISKAQLATKTSNQIQHLVVIFQENVSFDHYFATYPVTTKPPGEPAFTVRRKPLSSQGSVNGLSPGLLNNKHTHP